MTNFYNYHDYLRNGIRITGILYRFILLYPLQRLILGPKYVDLGCGLGFLLLFSPKKSIGLDVNEYNVKFITSKKLNALLINSNGEFPLPESSYPAMICDNVIEHIKDPTYLIKEIKRVLINNGNLLIGVPMEKGFSRDPDHKVFYDIKKIKKLFCERNNFKLNYYFYLPLPLKFFGRFISQQTLYISLSSIK